MLSVIRKIYDISLVNNQIDALKVKKWSVIREEIPDNIYFQ